MMGMRVWVGSSPDPVEHNIQHEKYKNQVEHAGSQITILQRNPNRLDHHPKSVGSPSWEPCIDVMKHCTQGFVMIGLNQSCEGRWWWVGWRQSFPCLSVGRRFSLRRRSPLILALHLPTWWLKYLSGHCLEQLFHVRETVIDFMVGLLHAPKPRLESLLILIMLSM